MNRTHRSIFFVSEAFSAELDLSVLVRRSTHSYFNEQNWESKPAEGAAAERKY